MVITVTIEIRILSFPLAVTNASKDSIGCLLFPHNCLSFKWLFVLNKISCTKS